MTVISRNALAVAPAPTGRGIWRVTLHNRQWTSNTNARSSIVAELNGARSRRLEEKLNAPSNFTFTIDGRSDAAALIRELQHDVYAWRWDDRQGVDFPSFRGIVAQTEDVLSEQVHTLNVTCHDYLSVMARRYLTQPYNWLNVNQDTIASYLVAVAGSQSVSSSGVSFLPGSFLPLSVAFRNPDGTPRSQGVGVPSRDRNYVAQSSIGSMFDELAHVSAGFDYGLVYVAMTSPVGSDLLGVYFPTQGVLRTDPLEYGSTLAGVTRSVNSADFANYVRVVGDNTSGDASAPQLFAEARTPDANALPLGLWQATENASDVSDVATLQQQADGSLARSSVLVPSYSLTLAPDVYYRDGFNMGDTVPVVIKSGRLNVNTAVRIVARTFDISDDGTENVALTVGRPLTSLRDMLTAASADIDALARR